jgi:hypothetical protein
MSNDKAPLPEKVEAALKATEACKIVSFHGSFSELAGPLLRAHIAALEAENKRLREALEVIAAQNSGIVGSTAKSDCMASIAKAALAQPAKVCGTCGGDGQDKQFNWACYDCKGTGRV